MKKKNAFVELYRFLGAIVILGHHSYILGDRVHFIGGWVFVEFYFMLTGYFTAGHFEVVQLKDNGVKVAVEYVKNKILRILPYAWSGILLGFCFYNLQPLTGIERMHGVLSLPTNLMLLQGISISNHSVIYNNPLWYIASIALFLPIIIISLNYSRSSI